MRGVGKTFTTGDQPVKVLAGVDLVVEPGELVAVVGPSGSGKSTMLHLAGGLDLPDTGTVEVLGRDVARMSQAERARMRRRDIGFVFQFFHLLGGLTAVENAALPLTVDRVRGAEQRAGKALERLGLAHRAGHHPARMSGGEMQRVAIARALVSEPALVLADEPTGNLDAQTGAEVLDILLEETREASTAMVLITHDVGVAKRADRVLALERGKLL